MTNALIILYPAQSKISKILKINSSRPVNIAITKLSEIYIRTINERRLNSYPNDKTAKVMRITSSLRLFYE